ncbi:FAD-dependent monooxygenase [Physcia stellaris]|nr:FAD-dependent monooxygenase [Physcia stellaris]
MYGFEWKDQRGVEGIGFVRALRSLLTAHLPSLLPSLSASIVEGLESEVSLCKKRNDISYVPIFLMIKRVVTRANCLIFFGPELSRNRDFTSAALEFPQAVIFAAEILRITPSFLKPIVASMATRGHRAAKTLTKHLGPVVEARLEARSRQGSAMKPVDCMQWLIDTSPRKVPWTSERMIGEIMALWFGSVHQLAMTTTFAIHDFCLYPDWVQELRHELSRASSESTPVDPESLALLDGFVQESMRMNTSDAISGRRKAITPFEFSDGLRVLAGDWVCLPQQAMMRDARFYPQPTSFEPTRFIRQGEQNTRGRALPHAKAVRPRFTDVGSRWPIWGLGTAACPGRFYASLAMKLILVHILKHYDCKLLDEQSPRSRSWRSSIVPRSSTIVLFQRRQNNDQSNAYPGREDDRLA